MHNYFNNSTTDMVNETIEKALEWLSVCLRTKWLWVRVPLQSVKLAPVSSKELLDIQATMECGLTLKCVTFFFFFNTYYTFLN